MPAELIWKLISWSDIVIWTMQWSLLNIRIWTFNWVWHEHCNDLFNIRNLVNSLILLFLNHIYNFLCDTILHSWFGKKCKWLKKFWGWKICSVYAYFFKHMSWSMQISFMFITKRVLLLETVLHGRKKEKIKKSFLAFSYQNVFEKMEI